MLGDKGKHPRRIIMKKKLIVVLAVSISLVLGIMSCEVFEGIAELYGSPSSSYSSSSSSYSSSSSSYSVRDGKYVSPNGGSGYLQLSGSSFTWYDSYGNYVTSGSVYKNGSTIKLEALSAGDIIDSETFYTGSTKWCWASY